MKKLLVLLGTVALVVWVVSWFRTPEKVATSGAQQWPGGLGTLDAAAPRFPARKANEAAVKLTVMANALPKSEALDEYVWREMERGEPTIGEPPAALPDVTAIRELLLRDEVLWEVRGGIGGGDDDTALRTMRLATARALAANALAKARANDPAAWEDLHAVWRLSRSLDGEPQMMTRTAALAMARMINALAWKMPLPAPAWLGELQQRDLVRPLLESFHFTAAEYWKDGSQLFPTKMLADSVEKDRGIAATLFTATQCDINVPMNDLGTDLRTVWRRAFRYRAEREATANAIRVREGKDIEPKSVCSDGTWSFDGTTLRFTRELATTPPDRPMPLVLKLK